MLTPAEVATHKHVIGLTGQGKSKLLASLFVQLIRQGIPCALIDPHSDLADDVLGLLWERHFFDDPTAYERLLYIDFARTDRFLPFNVLRQPGDPHRIALDLVEVCKRAWPALGDGAAPQFENVLLSSVVVLVENDLSLTALPKLLTDRTYREELLRHVHDPLVVDFFHKRFDAWGREAPLMVESALRRVFLLTFSPTLRYSLGQKDNFLDYRNLMDRGVSAIFNLGGLEEETQRLLGCLLTVGFEVAALSRADLREGDRRPYHLIVDEFAMFAASGEEALVRMLSLTRKYGLYLTMAHQTWSQVSSGLQGALQNAVEIAFQLGREDAQWAASRFGLFDPYWVKHVVDDPTAEERTHPMYFSVQETFEGWARALQNLKQREAFAKVGGRVVKIRTPKLPKARTDSDELRAIKSCYALIQMRAREHVVREVDSPPPEQAAKVRRIVDQQIVRASG